MAFHPPRQRALSAEERPVNGERDSGAQRRKYEWYSRRIRLAPRNVSAARLGGRGRKFVAFSPNRLCRIIFYFHPQPINVRVDRMLIPFMLIAPDLVEQADAGKDLIGMPGKEPQQVELARRQVKREIAQARFARKRGDGQSICNMPASCIRFWVMAS